MIQIIILLMFFEKVFANLSRLLVASVNLLTILLISFSFILFHLLCFSQILFTIEPTIVFTTIAGTTTVVNNTKKGAGKPTRSNADAKNVNPDIKVPAA